MRLSILSLLLIAITGVWIATERSAAAQDDAFDAFMAEQAGQLEEFQEADSRAFDAFLRADSIAFAEFQAEVERRWDRFVEPASQRWIEYEDDLSARSTVDFDKGEAAVEVIADQGASEAELHSRLQGKIERMITSRGTTDDFAGRATDPALGAATPVSDEPILAGQITADQRLEAQPRRSVFTGRDGVARVKVTLTLPLVPDHLRRRAERYLPEGRAQAASVAERKTVAAMPVELVLAIMQTESFFNPKARSHVPAFGLMQLVPRSGAKDALQYLGEEDRILSGAALYVPPRNIELGIA